MAQGQQHQTMNLNLILYYLIEFSELRVLVRIRGDPFPPLSLDFIAVVVGVQTGFNLLCLHIASVCYCII